MQILWYAIKNRYNSRQVKIQQLPPDKPKAKSKRYKKKKQKIVKFAENQERSIDKNHSNTVRNLTVWPILIVVPLLEKRINH